MFAVKKGTGSLTIKKGKDWYAPNFRQHFVTKDLLFDKEEVYLDPVGKLGCQQNDRLVGGFIERNGWYGFERSGWILLVPMGSVKYLD